MQIPENKLIGYLKMVFVAELPMLAVPGIKRFGTRSDVVLTTRFKDMEYSFFVEVKRSGYPENVRSSVDQIKTMSSEEKAYPLFFVPRMSEEGKKLCQRNFIGYIDLYGNVHIDTGEMYIHIEKDKLLDPGKFSGFMRNEQSVFSSRASRISKAFLRGGSKLWTQKELAEKTGLSKGLVSRVVRRMSEQGLVINKAGCWTTALKDELFSLWVEADMRRKERKRNYYVWRQFPEELIKFLAGTLEAKGIKYAFTAEAGASRVAAFSTLGVVDLYVESFEGFPASELSAVEASAGFNLVVREPYDESVFTDSRRMNGVNVVDDLQLFSDLKKNPLRGEKQASVIMESLRKAIYE